MNTVLGTKESLRTIRKRKITHLKSYEKTIKSLPPEQHGYSVEEEFEGDQIARIKFTFVNGDSIIYEPGTEIWYIGDGIGAIIRRPIIDVITAQVTYLRQQPTSPINKLKNTVAKVYAHNGSNKKTRQ